MNVLEVISNQGSATLAKDGVENLYVNTQPVTYQEQQAQTNIAAFAAIGATSEDGENALFVERASVTNRLVTDDAWRINVCLILYRMNLHQYLTSLHEKFQLI